MRQFLIRKVRVFWIFFFLLLVATSSSFANQYCLEKKNSFRPHVVFNTEYAEPYILHDRTFTEINQETEETRNTWLRKQGLNPIWSAKELSTLGYASGGMAAMTRSEFLAKPYDDFGSYYCPYFKNIEINIIYRTLIRIPKEFPENSCIHSVVLAHEMRHHKANRDSFERYIKKLEQDFPEMVKMYEKHPVKRAAVQNQFQNMKLGIDEAIKLYIEEFALREAARVNEQIDSPESYSADGKKIEECNKKTR